MFRALYSDKKVADMVARRSPLLSLVDRQRQASEPAIFVVTTSTPGAESTNGSIHPFVFNKRNGDAN